MSYEMPLDVLRQHLHLARQFLLATLAEHALSGVVRFLYVFGRMKLTDSHKSYALREAVRHLTKSVCNAHTLRSYLLIVSGA